MIENVLTLIPQSRLGEFYDQTANCSTNDDPRASAFVSVDDTSRVQPMMSALDGQTVTQFRDGEIAKSEDEKNTLDSLSLVSNSMAMDPNQSKQLLFVKRTPQILQVNSYLLFLLFTVFWMVSVFNLYYFSTKQDTIKK